MFNKVSVIGLGYIGLPTAAVLASRGLDVVGVDVNAHAVDTINKGEIHIVEPDLDIVVRSAVMTGKLKATLSAEPADAFLVAVPTPFKGITTNLILATLKRRQKPSLPFLLKGTWWF